MWLYEGLGLQEIRERLEHRKARSYPELAQMFSGWRRPTSPVYQIWLEYARGRGKLHSGDRQTLPTQWASAVESSIGLETAPQVSNNGPATSRIVETKMAIMILMVQTSLPIP